MTDKKRHDTMALYHRLIEEVTDDDYRFDAKQAYRDLRSDGVDGYATLGRLLGRIELMQRRSSMWKFEIEVDMSHAAFKDDADELTRVMSQGLARAMLRTEDRGVLLDINGNAVGSFKLTMPEETTR